MRLLLRAAIFGLGFTVFVVTLAGCGGLPVTTSASAPAPSAPAQVPAESTPAPQTSVSISTATPASASTTPTSPAASPDGYSSLDVLKDVHFGPASLNMLRADTRILDVVVGWLKENPTSLVLIEGYTDDLGAKAQNLTIGERRAQSIMKYLVSNGVEPDRITITSYGSDRPICTEKTAVCRAKNRRVHFLVKQR